MVSACLCQPSRVCPKRKGADLRFFGKRFTPWKLGHARCQFSLCKVDRGLRSLNPQQVGHIRPTAHRQSFRYPFQTHRRLAPQPRRHPHLPFIPFWRTAQLLLRPPNPIHFSPHQPLRLCFFCLFEVQYQPQELSTVRTHTCMILGRNIRSGKKRCDFDKIGRAGMVHLAECVQLANSRFRRS